jgi:SAM-dependent methyltransferase
MHPTSYKSMEIFRDTYLINQTSKKLKILDVGSYNVNGSYKPIFDFPNWQYTGLDISSGPNVDIIISDLYNWSEIATDYFDVVISGQALEHIEFIWLTMTEIKRVMKPGGFCCIICPSQGQIHKYPIDCWRILPDGMSALAKWAKLEVKYIAIPFQSEWSDVVFIGKK